MDFRRRGAKPIETHNWVFTLTSPVPLTECEGVDVIIRREIHSTCSVVFIASRDRLVRYAQVSFRTRPESEDRARVVETARRAGLEITQ